MRHKVIPAVHIFFVKDNQILLSRRENTGYMDGYYSVVAGHVDPGEMPKYAAVREIREEASVEVQEKDLKFLVCMPRLSDEERIDYFFECKNWKGEIENCEPEKCGELTWFDIDNLPEKMVPYVKKGFECYVNSINYCEFNESKLNK